MAKNIILVTGKKYAITGSEVFVTMTDKFLSGWGCAENKIAKRVVICPNRQKAELIKDRLFNPKHMMKNVNVVYNLPNYSANKYTTSYDLFSENMFNF
jgi:hypothetical protein